MSAFLAAPSVHVAIVSLLVVEAVLRAVRIRLLLPRAGGLSLWQAVEANAYGEAAGAVSPGRIAAEPARFYGLRRFGVGSASAIVALAVERVIDWVLVGAVAVVLVAAFGVDGYRGAIELAGKLGSMWKWVVPVVLLMVPCAAGMWWYRKRRPRAAVPGLMARASEAFRELPQRDLLFVSAITFVSIVARTSILPILLIPLDIEANAGVVILGSFTLIYSQLLLPTPSGAGGVELGFAAGFAFLPVGELAALMIMWRMYTLVLGAVFGGILLMRSLPFPRKLAGVAIVVFVLSVGVSSSAVAQQDLGSRTLPTDHWAYEQITHLRARGFLSNLNPLVQPYSRMSIATGLNELDPDTLDQPLRGWVELLHDEFRSDLARLRGEAKHEWGVELEAASRASSSQRLDPARPVGDAGIWPSWRSGVWIEHGSFYSEVRISGDVYWNDDPDGIDPGEKFGGRTDNAYVAIAFPMGAFTLGRLRQNWSALGTKGLMVSDETYAYPRATLELGLSKFRLRAMAGELDTLLGKKRYIIAHRLDYETPRFVASLGESILYAPYQGGFSLRYLNPVEVLMFDRQLEPKDQTINVTFGAQLWYRSGPLQLWFEGLLDDFSVYRAEDRVAPTRYGLVLGAGYTPPASPVQFGFGYERVSSFAYRNAAEVDRYTFLDRGLGANYSDYDRATLTVDVFPSVRGARLTPTFLVQRKGQGGIREPFPDYTVFRTSPALFLGVKETTYRFGLRGRYQPNRFMWLSWDVGENYVRNARHVEGDDRWEFTAVGELGLRIDLPLRRNK